MEKKDKIDDGGDDTVDMVIEIADVSEGSIKQNGKTSVTDSKSDETPKDSEKVDSKQNLEEDCDEDKKDEINERKKDVDVEKEEKSKNVIVDKTNDGVENLEDTQRNDSIENSVDKEVKDNIIENLEDKEENCTVENLENKRIDSMEKSEAEISDTLKNLEGKAETKSENVLNMEEDNTENIEDKKNGGTDVELKENDVCADEKSIVKSTDEKVKFEDGDKEDTKKLAIDDKDEEEIKLKENKVKELPIDEKDDIKEKDSKELVIDNKSEIDIKAKDTKQLVMVDEDKPETDVKKKDTQIITTEKLDNVEEENCRNKVDEKIEGNNRENIDGKEKEKIDENPLSEKVNDVNLDGTMDAENDNTEKNKEDKEKEIEKEKDESMAEKEDLESSNNTDSKEKQDSEDNEKAEKKESGNKPPQDTSEELQMEVDDDDKHSDELPDQINFVDVNAPPPCESPLTIDDDDDDDDIICMVDKGKTSTKPRKRMRRKGGGDSSPEIVQEDLRKNRREIVIDLDDDDDIEIETIKTRKKRNRTGGLKGNSCCNLECTNQDEDLRRAPVFVLSYYGHKYKKGKADKVCGQCFEDAMQHQEHLSYLLSEHIPLFSAEFRPKNDTVVLTDSDEEETPEDEYIPEDVLEDMQNQLQEVLESTLEKYDLDYQIRESENILNKRLDKLTEEFNETDDLLNHLQKKMDLLRYEVYKDSIPKIRELPALTIDDSQCGVKEPTIRVSPPSQGQRYQHQYSRQQPSTIQNRVPSVQTPQKQKYGPVQTPDPFRKSPLGVATKKVTQIQRSLGPSQPETVKKKSSTGSRTSETDEIICSSPSPINHEEWLPIENADHLGFEREDDEISSRIQEKQQRQEDVVALEQVEVTHKPLPPIGVVKRPKPQTGDIMYVMKLSFYGVWSRAKVLEVVPKGSELQSGILSTYTVYKVKFESSYRKSNPVRQVTGKQMAYTSPSPVRFPVGTRVIAIFQDNDWSKECYYSGVIAEPPKSMNNYRYLVFFDDGYAQYVTHEKILLVCESSRNVWDDIHPDSREFIRKYLEQYPERPMVKLQQGQIVKTEWNGKWWIARVVEVDGSLVKMHFDADGRTEWIYRGSTRLGPLYAELAHAAARKEQGTFSRHRGLGVASLKKRNMPYVEYTRGSEGEELRREDSGEGQTSESAPARAVAKKSTTKRPECLDRSQDHCSPPPIDKTQKPQGRVEYLQLNTSKRPRKFEPHQCGPNCLIGAEYEYKAMKGMNPLIIPMLCAWERQVNRCRGKRLVMYRAPCGRRLRNMEELHRYLRITKCNMAVDLFDFDFWVHCFAEFVVEKGFLDIKDLSYGAEHVPVPCVNCIDHRTPDYVKYSTKREPTNGVHLNLNPDFLTGCDCTDDCQDREKCACWQLTIQGTAFGPGGVVDPTVGYIYRRLPEPVMTGIYECNSRCKCSNTCLNRVAQQPLQLKLQVFKTENRGWGIRCLNDIPQGGFICIYAGRLLTEQLANEGGKNWGDEYLAELDYIEVVEKLKEGYESDVVEEDNDDDYSPAEEERSVPETKRTKESRPGSSASEEEAETSQNSDEEFQLTHWSKQSSVSEHNSIRTRLRNRSSRHGSEDSQADGRDKDKDDRDSDKASNDGRDARKGDGHKKSSRSVSSSDHNYSDEEDSERLRQPSKFAVISEPTETEKTKKPKCRSVREFFGEDEYCYIMDAKSIGNIGRFLNHSCSPNVFVQNVFVDTHDLRFPWVAFFALTYIHAGTELTWDYNYDVGSVPGKVLHCYCGSNDCRGRLL